MKVLSYIKGMLAHIFPSYLQKKTPILRYFVRESYEHEGMPGPDMKVIGV